MESRELDEPAKEANDSVNGIPTSQPAGNDAMGVVPPDWMGFQAYSHLPPYWYLASSPQPPPYMWGNQHLMPPYGVATPPYVMYPHGDLYSHPSMPPGSYPISPYVMPCANSVAESNMPGSMEVNSKSPPGKEKLPIKRSMDTLRSSYRDSSPSPSSSSSSSSSQGAALATMISTDEAESSHPKTRKDAINRNRKAAHDRMKVQVKSEDSTEGEAFQNVGLVNQTMGTVPMSAAAACPTANLNMRDTVAAFRSRENMQPNIWPQDEREAKRQRRKQANRESAQRSRLRKQAECDELARQAENLSKENAYLKIKVSSIRSHYEQLLAQNAALKGRLTEATGLKEPKQEVD